MSAIADPERNLNGRGAEIDTTSPTSPTGDWLVRVGLALTLLPLAVVGVHLLVRAGHYYPSGDVALTELHTRDVGAHMPRLGPYSRDGWHHPGPALFYLLALPYRLLGSSGAALSVAGLLVNGGSIAGMVTLAKRRGGTTLALSLLLVCGLLLRALGWEFLQLPWNVYVTVLPYGLLLFLVWAMACGERWALPVAAVVTTFLVQTHVGYFALATPLFGAGILGLVWPAVRWTHPGRQVESSAEPAAGLHDAAPGREVDAHEGPENDDDRAGRPTWRDLLWPGVWAAALGAVLWLPPLVEQLTTSPGNLRAVATWFRQSGDETRTLTEGWRVVAAQYELSPEWLTGASRTNAFAEPTYVYSGVVPVLLLPVLAAAVMLWRRRGRSERALVAIWLLGSVVGLVAAVRTVGLLYAYRLHWAWVLGMVGGLLVLWWGWQRAQEQGGDRLRRALTPVALVGLAVLSLAGSVTAVRADEPTVRVSGLLGDLAPALRDELNDLPGQADDDVVVVPTSFGAIGLANGLVLDLERHGRPGRVTGDGLGDHRQHDEDDPLRAVVAVVVDADIPQYLELPDHQLVAHAGVPVERLREDDDLPEYSAAAVFLVDQASGTSAP